MRIAAYSAAGPYFGSADFLIHSHCYVIRLTDDAGIGNAVGVGTERGIDEPLGDSFSDFVDLYLRDPDRVLLHS